jgi:glycine/D-amino acid oxidase-like deaminating enzyme/nitrite reductase/ring-hydroxylating ferredoxin subunit
MTSTMSLWRDRPAVPSDPELADAYDDVVVGAGLTGLTTALLLAKAGRAVAVIEARDIGAVTTGHTTGKVSLLQGTRLSRILERQSEQVAAAYVEANREGQAWLLRFCDTHSVPYQRRAAVTYAQNSEESLRLATGEQEAAARLGLDVRWQTDLEVPFPHRGGAVLADQAQVNAMDVLEALAGELRAAGGVVVVGRRVVAASLSGASSVELEDGGQIRCDNIVLATGTPILDRGLYFAKVEPERSYAVAFAYDAPPELMMLSAGSPTRSLRDAVGPDGLPRLVIGGEGHVVGRSPSEAECVGRLEAWTTRWFPGAITTHTWSAQDYASHDGVPFVGKMPRGRGHVYVATGYAKWGLTNGVAAALSIVAQIHGDEPSWSVPMSRRITRPSGALEIARLNAQVGLRLVTGFAGAELRPMAPDTEEARDGGSVRRDGFVPVARSRAQGETCSLVGLCTHLGGTLHWNDLEQTWDCPLHGSRFDRNGAVLEGPATKPLRRRRPADAPTHQPPR